MAKKANWAANLNKLIKSPEYRDTKKKIKGWRERLEKADKKETISIQKEKIKFFTKLKKKSPTMYSVFQIDEKELSERVLRKLTGKSIVID